MTTVFELWNVKCLHFYFVQNINSILYVCFFFFNTFCIFLLEIIWKKSRIIIRDEILSFFSNLRISNICFILCFLGDWKHKFVKYGSLNIKKKIRKFLLVSIFNRGPVRNNELALFVFTLNQFLFNKLLFFLRLLDHFLIVH